MPQEKYVLSANIYDALELVAHVYGGIGADQWFHKKPRNDYVGDTFLEDDRDCPVCINGMAVFLGLTQHAHPTIVPDVGIDSSENDDAVGDLIDAGRFKKDAYGTKRVSFADYTKKLHIVRGAK